MRRAGIIFFLITSTISQGMALSCKYISDSWGTTDMLIEFWGMMIYGSINFMGAVLLMCSKKEPKNNAKRS